LRVYLFALKKANQAGNEEFHIISGHHRVRAARKAMILNIPCLVIEREMSTDEIVSKQLSHNSLTGFDDKQVLKALYDEIQNIDFKIASGLTDQEINFDLDAVSIDDIKLNLDYELINILFLAKHTEKFEEVINSLAPEAKIYLADKEDFNRFAETVRKVSARDNIKNVGTIMVRMMDIVEEYLKNNPKEEKKD